MTRPSAAARRRWSIAFRVIAGTLGAYGLTSLVTVALSLLLARSGMDRVEAVTAATLASFGIFAVICMMVFHTRSAVRAWISLLGLAVILRLVALVLMPENAT